MFRTLQALVYFALYAAVFAVTVYALIDALRRPARAFVSGGKRTKQFWTVLLGIATAVAFVAIPWPIGFGMLSFLALGSAVAGGVYLADVRPAIKPYSGGGGSGRSGGPSRGW